MAKLQCQSQITTTWPNHDTVTSQINALLSNEEQPSSQNANDGQYSPHTEMSTAKDKHIG